MLPRGQCILSHCILPLLSGAIFFSDINELNLPKTCGTEFPDPDDLLSFKLIICPDEVSKRSPGAPYGLCNQCHFCRPVGIWIAFSVDSQRQLLSILTVISCASMM